MAAASPASSPPLPQIKSYQLFVGPHEDSYASMFSAADLSNYKYEEVKVDKVMVSHVEREGAIPAAQPEHSPKPQPWMPRWRQRLEQVRDKHLDIKAASNTSYKVCTDRRLRPVVLAVHKKDTRPLPDLAADPPSCGVQPLEQALQSMVGVIFGEELSPLPPPVPSAAGEGGDACSDGAAGESSSSVRVGSSAAAGGMSISTVGGDLPAQPPARLLVIHASEGIWRESNVIHLKAPVYNSEAYTGFLRRQLHEAGYALQNHGGNKRALLSELCRQYSHMTEIYRNLSLRPIVSNFTRLGDAQQLLEPRPDLFFRVPDEKGELTGGEGLGAVWYGCRNLPRLVATLPGRPLNGLSLGEALGCMDALWRSELKKRLFAHRTGVTEGLMWVLVPCFA